MKPALLSRSQARRAFAERGIVLLTLLIALSLAAIGMMAAVDLWSFARQHEREQELLFVGDQYRRAIRHYYLGAPPGARRTLPPSVDVLLSDDRYPIPVRHLRRAYHDPITGSAEWGLLRIDERIIGVYSLSEKVPLKVAGFTSDDQTFTDAATYRDWVFAYRLPRIAFGPSLAASGIKPVDKPSPVSPTPVRRSPP
jgi:type II secretory pathway pseudopilin PulG